MVFLSRQCQNVEIVHQTFKAFKEFIHSREESEKEKLKNIEEMHNEKMAFMGRFLQAFEKSLDKN